ncbi:MAG: cell wall metabolism sensor histidine kinase WalK [Pseudomonadales bacterium]|nr:cell wall metabolism sensor histidine kinase WalK [Pseudomonadales bacterium]
MLKSRLFWQLYAGYITVIITSTIIVGVLVSRQVTENSLEEIHHSLAVRAELLAQIARPELLANTKHQYGAGLASNATDGVDINSPELVSLQQIILQLGLKIGSRLTIITIAGQVLADSEQAPRNMDNHGQRPEIVEAGEKGFSTVSRLSDTLQQKMIYRALRLSEEGSVLGFVRVSLPLSIIDQKLVVLRLIVLFGASLSAVAAIVLGFYFAGRFTEPLTKMTQVAEAISQGDYNRRIDVQQRGEVGTLARAFNRMARSSEQRMAEITTDRNRLAKIFAGMVEGVISVDDAQNIIHINQAAADLLGLSIATCINKPIWEEVRIQEINQALEQSIQRQAMVKTQVRRASDAEDLVIDIYAATLSNRLGVDVLNGDPTNADLAFGGAVIVLHDISELDRLERIRRDFVANASHELKTPITAIRGLSETILGDVDMPSDTRQKFIVRMHAQSLRLSALVTDLMAISRFESAQHKQNFQSVDLVEVARQSVAAAEITCRQDKITLTAEIADSNIIIAGDSEALRQLIDNLIDNAIKYTEAGGSIGVALLLESKSVRLVVQDTGIGISASFQQRIFERFYRVDKARSRALGGTGLGLSIVKNIAEQHGGSIKVESQLAVGSIFTLTLPV